MILKIETNFLIKIIKEMSCKKFPNTLNQNSLHKNLKASPNNYATPRPKNVKSVPCARFIQEVSFSQKEVAKITRVWPKKSNLCAKDDII